MAVHRTTARRNGEGLRRLRMWRFPFDEFLLHEIDMATGTGLSDLLRCGLIPCRSGNDVPQGPGRIHWCATGLATGLLLAVDLVHLFRRDVVARRRLKERRVGLFKGEVD